MTPHRIDGLEDHVEALAVEQARLAGDVRALTAAIKTAVVLLAGNGALNLADLLR